MSSEYDLQTDEELLVRLQDGNTRAFECLVRRHTDRFYRIAWRSYPNNAEAEDIVQEAFMKLWKSPGLFDPNKGTKFTTWFYRVVTNLALDKLRKKKPVYGDDLIDLISDSQNEPAEIYKETQEQCALEQAIQELPERQKTALNLCFYEGLSNKEAADVMQIGTKALESLLMRAKAGVRDTLMKQGAFARETVA